MHRAFRFLMAPTVLLRRSNRLAKAKEKGGQAPLPYPFNYIRRFVVFLLYTNCRFEKTHVCNEKQIAMIKKTGFVFGMASRSSAFFFGTCSFR